MVLAEVNHLVDAHHHLPVVLQVLSGMGGEEGHKRRKEVKGEEVSDVRYI